jgi:GH24 family phage-related lysozyme (muramidase)
MYTGVRSIFPAFSVQFEGRVGWMYLDVKGLVTIGIGNLIDPVSAALGLPFVHRADGSAASRDEIGSEWSALKNNPSLAQRGHLACKPLTQLGLTDAAIDDLVRSRLDGNEVFLKQAFPDWESWPADAQLGLLSMAWALGAGFPPHWPNFTAACKNQDWTGAAANCHMSEVGNPGLIPRNKADVTLFTNASTVAPGGLDPSILIYQVAGQG